PTHAGSFDVAYLGCLPNFVVMAAADEAELVHMVATQVALDDRPSALRYPRGEGLGVEMPEEGKPLEIGKGRVLREGHKVALLSFGAYVLQTLAEHGALENGLRVRTMVLPDTFIDQDTPAAMYAQAGLDAKGIVTKVFEALGRDAAKETVKLA